MNNRSNKTLSIVLICIGIILTILLIIFVVGFGIYQLYSFQRKTIETVEKYQKEQEDEWKNIKPYRDNEKKDTHVEMPFGEKQDGKVLVYFFRGEGCPHCEEAENWFKSIQEEYGSKFKIIDYEVWYNSENAALMQKISDTRGDDASGVPYIIIGDKSWIGYTEDYNEEIINQIIQISNKE